MEALNLVAKPVPPREMAQVCFTNGKGAFEAPLGTILEEYVRAAYPDRWRIIVGAVIDGKRVEEWSGDRWKDAFPILLPHVLRSVIARNSVP